MIGVDNDELLCSLCNPPLSSVIPNPERIGYEAAVWLDRMMRGEEPSVRRSRCRRKASRFGNRPTCLPCRDPDDRQRAAVHSRAGLRRRARSRNCSTTCACREAGWKGISASCSSRSPQAEIRNVQIKRCKELLRTTYAVAREDCAV